jgi:hypothetical protein
MRCDATTLELLMDPRRDSSSDKDKLSPLPSYSKEKFRRRYVFVCCRPPRHPPAIDSTAWSATDRVAQTILWLAMVMDSGWLIELQAIHPTL